MTARGKVNVERRMLFPSVGGNVIDIEKSIGALSDMQARWYVELAVFEGQNAVPAAVVVGFLRYTSDIDRAGAESLLQLFASRGIITVAPAFDIVTLPSELFRYARDARPPEFLAGLHGRLGGWLLDEWGGLNDNQLSLPLLGEAVNSDVGRYGLDALVGHLLAAGDLHTVDMLLAAEGVSSTGQPVSVWYGVHDELGLVDGYLTDVREAWRDSSSRYPAGGVEAFVAQVGYALLLGSVAGLAAGRGGGVMTDPADRAEPLVVLAPHLPVGLLARTLGAVGAIDEPGARAVSLARLAPCLPADLLAQAFAVAGAIDVPAARAMAVTRMAPCLPVEERGPVLAEAVAIAGALEEPDERAWAWAELVSRLPVEERSLALTWACDAAALVVSPYARAELLTELMSAMAVEKRAPIVAQALAAASAVDDADNRALILANLVPQVPNDERDRVLIQTIQAATDNDWPFARTAWTRLVPQLPEHLLGRAVAAAVGLAEPDERALALAELAPRLPAADRGPVLARALSAASMVTSAYTRVFTLARLAQALTAGERYPLLEQALGAAGSVAAPGGRARALAALAEYLPDTLLDQATTTALAIEEPDDRALALAALIRHLAPARQAQVFAQALEAASSASRARVIQVTLAALEAGLVPAQLAAAPVATAILRVYSWWP